MLGLLLTAALTYTEPAEHQETPDDHPWRIAVEQMLENENRIEAPCEVWVDGIGVVTLDYRLPDPPRGPIFGELDGS